MSGPHATISAWERDEEEGSYTAEFHGWDLKVSWTPNQGDTRGYFSWSGEAGKRKVDDEDRHEEMEIAMAAAEHYASEHTPDQGAHDADASEED